MVTFPGGTSTQPDKNFILTQAEKKDISRYWNEFELAKNQTRIQSKRDEGIYNIASRVAMEQSDKISEWRERPEAMEALEKYRKISRLYNVFERDDLDETGKQEILEGVKNQDIDGVLNSLTENNVRRMQREKVEDLGNEQEPEKIEIQEEQQTQRKKRSSSFEM
ncbi:hypothetical protein [Gluconobacter roseus]|uniref:hypothetical protein n=1 Tax=Gluconobacter roseus TaxID=586239 RepID=UPI0038D13419